MGQLKYKRYTDYLWNGNYVYQESFGFFETAAGVITSGTFLFEPTKIISVTSTDSTIEYTQVIDFIICGKQLIRTENSRIPYCPLNEYSPLKEDSAFDWLTAASDSQRYIKIASPLHHDQIIITYEHKDSWKGFLPTSQIDKLPRFSTLLTSKQPIKIVFFGDSITAGCDASGCNELAIDVDTIQEKVVKNDRTPHLPSWANLVITSIKEKNRHDNITYINRAAPSSNSDWGIKNVFLVTETQPDLAVIAFGMNETQKDGITFGNNIRNLIKEIRRKKSNTDILLVSCMNPNPDIKCFEHNKLKEQENALLTISKEFYSIVVARVHSVFEALTNAGKLFTDYASNNVNHPNDFAVRVYAQTILATLEI